MPRCLLHSLGNAARRIPGPIVELEAMLHYLGMVGVLLQDGPQLGRG